MSDNDSVFRKPLRVIKWLGYNTLEQHPLARMLHEQRAAQAAKDKALPLTERRSYQIRQQRVYARGREAMGGNEIAKPPEPASSSAGSGGEAAPAGIASPAMEATAPRGPVIAPIASTDGGEDFLLQERADNIINNPDL